MKACARLLVASVVLSMGTASAQTVRDTPEGTKFEDPTGLRQRAMTEVERVLLGAPARLKEQATVIKWRPDYTYETLKQGGNGLVCYDRADQDRRYTFAVQCTNLGNLPRVAQNRRFRAESKSAADEQAMIKAAEKNGTRVKPEYGSTFININGDDITVIRSHTVINLPGATKESTGLPDRPHQSGAWLMDAGTTAAHIMLPGQ